LHLLIHSQCMLKIAELALRAASNSASLRLWGHRLRA
jgi:hypothetical protein